MSEGWSVARARARARARTEPRGPVLLHVRDELRRLKGPLPPEGLHGLRRELHRLGEHHRVEVVLELVALRALAIRRAAVDGLLEVRDQLGVPRALHVEEAQRSRHVVAEDLPAYAAGRAAKGRVGLISAPCGVSGVSGVVLA